MSHLVMLVGPPGSGKSTMAHNLIHNDGDMGAAAYYINQDTQGKGHMEKFLNAVHWGGYIIVDRMNFNKQQRAKYIEVAKKAGYKVHVRVLCESQETCLKRMLARENHPTIKDEQSARSAMQLFFTKYEPPTKDEGIDTIEYFYPKGPKPSCIVVDLDGTLCNVEHRRHFVRDLPEGQKKDWNSFFRGIKDDTVNSWCLELVNRFRNNYEIVYCSGRSENWKRDTVEWLHRVTNQTLGDDYKLYMRHRADSRQDYLVKEILLDFEILTRYKPFFMIDDRKQIVDLWRRRGFVCLHCDEGDF